MLSGPPVVPWPVQTGPGLWTSVALCVGEGDQSPRTGLPVASAQHLPMESLWAGPELPVCWLGWWK